MGIEAAFVHREQLAGFDVTQSDLVAAYGLVMVRKEWTALPGPSRRPTCGLIVPPYHSGLRSR